MKWHWRNDVIWEPAALILGMHWSNDITNIVESFNSCWSCMGSNQCMVAATQVKLPLYRGERKHSARGNPQGFLWVLPWVDEELDEGSWKGMLGSDCQTLFGYSLESYSQLMKVLIRGITRFELLESLCRHYHRGSLEGAGDLCWYEVGIVGEEKSIACPSEFSAETPVMKDWQEKNK